MILVEFSLEQPVFTVLASFILRIDNGSHLLAHRAFRYESFTLRGLVRAGHCPLAILRVPLNTK